VEEPSWHHACEAGVYPVATKAKTNTNIQCQTKEPGPVYIATTPLTQSIEIETN
jgi:hypothetical protein